MLLFKLSLVSLLVAVNAAVIEATDKTLPKLLSNGKFTILDLYAEWCGHCKNFAPVFDKLAASFEKSDKIQFVKIDGSIHRKAAQAFKIEYFPTVLFLDQSGKKSELIDDRDLASLKKLVTKKIGSKAGKAKKNKVAKADKAKKANKPKPADVRGVEALTKQNFAQKTANKNALVSFTAQWCGHCKNLKPIYEEVGKLFKHDSDILIGDVDCTDPTDLVDKYDIKGFPTVLFFPKDGSKPVTYQGSRSVEGFTSFLAKNAGSHRRSDGTLDEKAGIIESVSLKIGNVVGASDESLAKIRDTITASDSKYSAYYLRVLDKIVSGGKKYLKTEIARLGKLLKSKVTPEKHDDLTSRLNILKSILGPDSAKDEL